VGSKILISAAVCPALSFNAIAKFRLYKSNVGETLSCIGAMKVSKVLPKDGKVSCGNGVSLGFLQVWTVG
jgi:hypothetical protein